LDAASPLGFAVVNSKIPSKFTAFLNIGAGECRKVTKINWGIEVGTRGGVSYCWMGSDYGCRSGLGWCVLEEFLAELLVLAD
jgi:hypothetical protein